MLPDDLAAPQWVAHAGLDPRPYDSGTRVPALNLGRRWGSFRAGPGESGTRRDSLCAQLAPVDSEAGQTRVRQIDCLRDVGTALGNADGGLWEMRNGYALCSESGLDGETVLDPRIKYREAR